MALAKTKTKVERPEKAPLPSTFEPRHTTTSKADSPERVMRLQVAPPIGGRANLSAFGGGILSAPRRAQTFANLQRTVGNTQVSQLVAEPSPTGRDTMAAGIMKPSLSSPRTPEEQGEKEAPTNGGALTAPIQRQCIECAGEEKAPKEQKSALVQRQEEGKGGAPTAASQSAESQGATQATAPSYVTDDLKTKIAATILAESWPGQEADIRWIYFNRVASAQGEKGLEGSAAYAAKGLWYRISLYVLGDTTYGEDVLPKTKDFKGFSTIAEFCDKNAYMNTVAAKRGEQVKALVEDMFTQPSANPMAGWIGQGNLNDFNNISQPGSLYWKQARAYYWLQEEKKVSEIYVKMLPAGKNTQVLFNATAIQHYFETHSLPQKVPQYSPPP